MQTLALVDADAIIYKVAATNAKAGGSVEDLHFHLQSVVDSWVEMSGAEDYRLYATFAPTFRHHFYPEYKSNRVGKPKPRGLSYARAWLRKHPKCVWQDGYEADDLIATAATCPSCGAEKTIVGEDKDYKQVAGVRWVNPTKDTEEVGNHLETLIFRLEQWVCGDSTDGYGGIYRYGPKTFEKDFLKAGFGSDFTWSDLYKWGMQQYEDRDYDRTYAEQMLVCSQILSHQQPSSHRALVRKILAEMG